jgi:hypothetical protein
MHALILTSAVAVTSGLFGGGRATCATGQCGGSVAQVATYQYTYAPAAYFAPQAAGSYAQPVSYYSTARGFRFATAGYRRANYVGQAKYVYPAAYAQPAAAAPAPAVNVATAAPAYYYTTPTTSMYCTSGGCYRR